MKMCHQMGATVYLVTSKKHEDKPWPRECLKDVFYVQQGEHNSWNMEEVVAGLAFLMRQIKIDRIVALDDFDVEKAALLREHFRIPGMGQTTAHYFRDKLAMRIKAQESGIKVPAFSSLFNNDRINQFLDTIPSPWLIKPRSEASASGIKKVDSKDEAWKLIEELGNERHLFLIEQFKPGKVFHVDSLSEDGEFRFCRVSEYLSPPFDVAHGGGIFRSVICDFDGKDDKALQALNKQVMNAFGMQYSASHTEFIQCHEDGEYYFLETASRVGGAHLADMIEASSGINLWEEWAKLELAVATGVKYKLPKIQKEYAGILVTLTKYEKPDYSTYTDKEIWWTMTDMDYHIGLILKSKNKKRVLELLDVHATQIYQDLHSSMPAPKKATH